MCADATITFLEYAEASFGTWYMAKIAILIQSTTIQAMVLWKHQEHCTSFTNNTKMGQMNQMAWWIECTLQERKEVGLPFSAPRGLSFSALQVNLQIDCPFRHLSGIKSKSIQHGYPTYNKFIKRDIVTGRIRRKLDARSANLVTEDSCTDPKA